MTNLDNNGIFEAVCGVVQRIASAHSMQLAEVSRGTSLVAELGFTSLELVDLALELEKALGLHEYPMQEWIDAENARGDAGFRVASIVDTCVAVLAATEAGAA